MAPKEQICRFCHQGELTLLYAPTNTGKKRDVQLYTCTNCGFGLHGPIVSCPKCQIVYVNENLTQKQISTFYEVAEDPLYFHEQDAREKTFQGYLKKLDRYFPQKGKLLDVGTNTGLFVKLARNDGWSADGLEPNKSSVEYAKKHYKIDLVAKPFEKGVFPRENFAVITMWDVIEHFTDPIQELEKVYWYLKPSGMFAFSTVDPSSLLAKAMGTKWSWYMEMHRVFFNRTSAKNYLKNVGFKKIIFTPHWRFLSAGYLSSRLAAVNPFLSSLSSRVINSLGLNKTIVPYYANDLYDCYAFK